MDQSTHVSNPESLLAGLREGEERAFGEIIRQYLHPLRYYAWTFVHNKITAEELAYDSFVKLWQARERFTNAPQVRSFLYVVTKHACLDHLKSARTRYERHTDEADSAVANEPDLEARMIQTELLEAIYREINNLPDKQRDVFRLSFLEGLSAEEISVQLGITINAVYLNKSLATKSLQRVFEGKNLLLFLSFMACFADN